MAHMLHSCCFSHPCSTEQAAGVFCKPAYCHICRPQTCMGRNPTSVDLFNTSSLASDSELNEPPSPGSPAEDLDGAPGAFERPHAGEVRSMAQQRQIMELPLGGPEVWGLGLSRSTTLGSREVDDGSRPLLMLLPLFVLVCPSLDFQKPQPSRAPRAQATSKFSGMLRNHRDDRGVPCFGDP